MPKVLLVRLSSLGDVVQTFPAATDMMRALPGLQLDWAVEEAYAPLVALHPAVRTAIPVAFRRWRKNVLSLSNWREFTAFRKQALREHYDAVIDAQGLIKSMVIARSAHGETHGFGPATARESFVSRYYANRYEFPAHEHRVLHYRGLCAAALGYEPPPQLDYGIPPPAAPAWARAPYAVLLHATAREEKLWPEGQWVKLVVALRQRGVRCVLPWGDAEEKARADRIAALSEAGVTPPLSLPEAAGLLAHAAIVVGVDTGLMHLAVALRVPVVGIYCATEPGHHGPLGEGPLAHCGGKGRVPDVNEVLQAVERIGPRAA